MFNECLIEILADAAIVDPVTSFFENLKLFAHFLVREMALLHFLLEDSLKFMPAFADQVETGHELHPVGLVDGILETDRFASSNSRDPLLHQTFGVANLSVGEPASGRADCFRCLA